MSSGAEQDSEDGSSRVRQVTADSGTDLFDVPDSVPSGAANSAELERTFPCCNAFGPDYNPLFYTALLSHPQRLAGKLPEGSGPFVLWLETAEPRTRLYCRLIDTRGFFRVPIGNIELAPGMRYRWGILPAGVQDPTIDDLNAEFWILEPGSQERIDGGLELLRERSDIGFLAMAEAIFLAESQLYHHALSRIPYLKDTSGDASSVLNDTVRSVIFRQMVQHTRNHFALSEGVRMAAEQNEALHRQRAEQGLAMNSGSEPASRRAGQKSPKRRHG